jgi:hypothetical protein
MNFIIILRLFIFFQGWTGMANVGIEKTGTVQASGSGQATGTSRQKQYLDDSGPYEEIDDDDADDDVLGARSERAPIGRLPSFIALHSPEKETADVEVEAVVGHLAAGAGSAGSAGERAGDGDGDGVFDERLI